MPDTAKLWNGLAPETTQVLVCDLQQEIVARSKTTEPKQLARSAAVLLKVAKLFSLPVTLSVVPEGDKEPTLVDGLTDHVGFAPQLLRTSASPFLSEATVDVLAANARKTLIIAGFASEVVVLQAALDAISAGYQVLVAVDACGGMSERTEFAAFRHMETAGAVLTSVVSLSTALAPDFTTVLGKQMFSRVQDLRLS